MKNILKTTLYSFVAVILFGFSAAPAYAQAVFNNHSSDYPTILVSNYTNNPGSNQNWQNSISANAGDVVSVLIYYHNNGDENALSTKLKLNQGPTLSSAQTHVFSGSVDASNTSASAGSATINLSSSQSLTYVSGSAKWYPNQAATEQVALPFGQSGTEVFSASGANIGTVAPGWNSQGSFVVQFKVSEAQQQQPPVVTTNQANVTSNTQATLNGYVNGQGLNPYTYFIYGLDSNLGQGSSTTTEDYQLSTNTSFSEVVYVNANSTYHYKACATTNAGTVCGSPLSFTTQPNNVTVYGCTDSNATNYNPNATANNGSCNYDSVEEPVVVTEDASGIEENSAILNGEVVSMGGDDQVSFLRFDYGTNANNLNSIVYAQDSSVSSPDNFHREITGLYEGTTYYFQACGTNSVGEDCGSIKSFTTDEDNNDNNNDADLEVSTKSANGVNQNQATLRGEIIDTDGEDVVRYFEYGDDEDDLDFTLGIPGVTDNDGDFSATLFGLYPNTDYYFRACIEMVDSPYDEDCGSVRDFRTSGSTIFNPNPQPQGNLQSVTTFATGISGTSAALNGVSTNNTNNNSVSFFEYGTTYSLGYSTPTQAVSAGQVFYNSRNVVGLLPNTTYYFRIVTGNVPGQIQSFKTKSLSTVVVTNTTTNTTTTNTGGGGGIVYLALDIEADFENVYAGDVINFDVDYRNLYNGDLEDVIIQVMFPEEIDFRKSTRGFYSEADRALIVDLGDLEDNEKGTFLVQGEVLGRFNNQDMVVTIAEGTYDHPTIENAQGSSTAYALNTVLLDRSTLGAFAFGAGFIPGLFGWLILLLLLLLIVWISRRIYSDHQDRKTKQGGLQIN